MFSGPAENDAGPSPATARVSMTPGCPLWVKSRHRHVRVTSVIPLKADIRQREWHVRLCAMCGRLLVGKSKHHVASLVGAAMCSAC